MLEGISKDWLLDFEYYARRYITQKTQPLGPVLLILAFVNGEYLSRAVFFLPSIID